MKIGRRIAILLAASLIAAPMAQAEEPKGPLAPRNDCGKLEGFSVFENILRNAIAQKDADALLELADDKVSLDFGGGFGKAEWRKRLDGDHNNWSDLSETMELGCNGSMPQSESDRMAEAAWPWFWMQDQGEIDPYAALLVTGNNVLLRSGPSRGAAPIGRVSWDWVDGDYEPAVNGYRKVKTLSGQTGYMAEQYLRHLIDYRLVAARTPDGWRITAFIAGD